MTDDRAALERDGFVVLDAPDGLTELDLGRCLHVQEVRVRPTSRSLVCSRRALGPHTDHHAARWVVLRCIEPAARGGRSLLIDGGAVVAELPRDMREALRRSAEGALSGLRLKASPGEIPLSRGGARPCHLLFGSSSVEE